MPAATHTTSTPVRAFAAALVALLATLAFVAGAAPGTASAKPQIGFGDQHPSTFFDARFPWLQQKGQNRIARLVVPWDWEQRKLERRDIDTWIKRARSYGVEPFVQFGRSNERRFRYDTPSPKRFRTSGCGRACRACARPRRTSRTRG